MKRMFRTLLALVLVSGILAGTLYALTCFLRLQDARMVAGVYPRTVHTDELSQQAERIDVVRALWEVENFYDGLQFYDSTQSAPITNKQPRADTLALFEGLKDADVISSSLLDTAKAAIDSSWESTKIQGKLNFAQLYVGDVSGVVWNSTLLTSFMVYYTQEPETLPLVQAVKAYAAYLGVGQLEDWEMLPQKEGVTFQSAAMYSAQAQLYLSITQETYDTYTLFYGNAISAAPEIMRRNA